MSADNGIYILQTPKGNGFEYRVREIVGVENIYYKYDYTSKDNPCGGESDNPDVWIKNARHMWSTCEVFTNKTDAYMKADDLANNPDCYILEYGICMIKIDREF